MKIGISSDHRGYEKKQKLIDLLKEKYDITDFGNDVFDQEDDYPDYAIKVSEAVAKGELDYGITMCGSGIGVSIAANKVKGIRCAKVDNIEDAKLSKKDNNSNVIALNSSKPIAELKDIIEAYLTTDYELVPRYQRRIDKISSYEEK
ncbi:MAG: RpiB/LacA/LacB family sugar-phosphate isomerase [Mollicutes bacterium]|jgi:ribose 5-phosphate isomerase B|nr:RpiB/LacA/LacB family sugar-phosphate isomerase [Mollicutes bacterium]